MNGPYTQTEIVMGRDVCARCCLCKEPFKSASEVQSFVWYGLICLVHEVQCSVEMVQLFQNEQKRREGSGE